MKVYEKDFVCRRCGDEFRLRARKAYFCPKCRRKHLSESVMRHRAARDPKVAIGVGSGGNQRGPKNHRFKDGRSNYRDVFRTENAHQRSCEVCFSTRHLVIHHVDWNRKNNLAENLVMLCRSCHAQVHGIVANLGETPMIAEAVHGRDFGNMIEIQGE